MSNGLSGMGYGIAAAVAAQLEYPDQAVMAVVGDGGMLMMLHELVLIRELNLPIIIVVLTDGSLSLIQIAQERLGFLRFGVNFKPPDFASVAKGFGASQKHRGSQSGRSNGTREPKNGSGAGDSCRCPRVLRFGLIEYP